MSVIGATFLGIVIIWVLVTLSARDDEKKKKKRIRTYKESYKKEIDTFYKDKLSFKPEMEKSISTQKKIIERADKNELIDWYKKTLIACHDSAFKEKLNKLKKLESVLKKHVPIEELHLTSSPLEKKPPNNPAAMYFEDAIKSYKEYGYENLFKGYLYSIHKDRLIGGDISYQHFSPLECIAGYKKIYLEQHKKNLEVEEKIKKELKEIIDDFEVWKNKTIKNMTDFVNNTATLKSDSLVYFLEEYPLSLNYNNSKNVNPFAFPWINSSATLRDILLGSSDEERNLINGMRADSMAAYYNERNNPYLEKEKSINELIEERLNHSDGKVRKEAIDLLLRKIKPRR